MDIFDLEPKHLDVIVKAHMETWCDSELSVLLGKGFVRHFYQFAIESAHTYAMGGKVSSEPFLSAWCLGFTNYSEFNLQLKKKIGPALLKKITKLVLTRRLSVGLLFGHVFGPKPNRNVDFHDVHLGAFGRIGNKFEEVLLLSKLVEHVAEKLCESYPACWAVTNKINRGARVVLQKAGFYQCDEIRLSNQLLVVYQFGDSKDARLARRTIVHE